jgi:prefoldin subunit 5
MININSSERIVSNCDFQNLGSVEIGQKSYSRTYESLFSISLQIHGLKDFLSKTTEEIENLETDVQSLQMESKKLWSTLEAVNNQSTEEIKKIHDITSGLIKILGEQELRLSNLQQVQQHTELELRKKFEQLDILGQQAQELQRIMLVYGNNSEHLTPLHSAIKSGDKRAVELMVQNGVGINLMDGGYSPLHRAIEADHLDIAALLIRFGADVNIRDKEGYTSLHKSIEANKIDSVLFLLQNGANTRATVQKGLAEFQCLNLARETGSPELIGLFIDKDVAIFEERVSQHFLEANLKKANPIELAFQKRDYALADHLLQMREQSLILKKQTFEFPGYEFHRSFLVNNYPHGGYPAWQKLELIKRKGKEGIDMVPESRVDIEAVKVLMKYDSKNLWHKQIQEWIAKSYRSGDLEAIAFLYPLTKTANIQVSFPNQDHRYLIDPFLSNVPLNLEDSSHIYTPPARHVNGSQPPSLFDLRAHDNPKTKELKNQIKEMLGL